jgi:Na+-transporting methylmalonyl-CoA/oxaloacetate decarboxylase gamma subunit
MDLTLFIVLIIIAYMLYYLTSAIQSLIKEMREVKQKCVKIHNTKVEDFSVSTEDPAARMKEKGVAILQGLQNMLGKST